MSSETHDYTGQKREPCDCGRLKATDADWDDPNIDEGDRDDLCWGIGTNHEFEWPNPELVA